MNATELTATIGPRVNSDSSPADVAALLDAYATDAAWIHLGGSGARQQILRLLGDLRAVFQFDDRDRLVGYAFYESSAPWGDGTQPAIPESDVALILV